MSDTAPMWTDADGRVWIGVPLATYTLLRAHGVGLTVPRYEAQLDAAERTIARLTETIERMAPHVRMRALREATQ